MRECLDTSLTAPRGALDAAAAAAAAAPVGLGKPGSRLDAAPRLTCLSPVPGSLLWSHWALIRSRSWVSSIPVPSSSSSVPAAVANRASQEPARCSCRARAACRQTTEGTGGGGMERRGEGVRAVERSRGSEREMKTW